MTVVTRSDGALVAGRAARAAEATRRIRRAIVAGAAMALFGLLLPSRVGEIIREVELLIAVIGLVPAVVVAHGIVQIARNAAGSAKSVAVAAAVAMSLSVVVRGGRALDVFLVRGDVYWDRWELARTVSTLDAIGGALSLAAIAGLFAAFVRCDDGWTSPAARAASVTALRMLGYVAGAVVGAALVSAAAIDPMVTLLGIGAVVLLTILAFIKILGALGAVETSLTIAGTEAPEDIASVGR